MAAFLDYIDAIPIGWFVENDGQAIVLDPAIVGRVVMAAQSVIKQWPRAGISHEPMIEELERLRDALAPERS